MRRSLKVSHDDLRCEYNIASLLVRGGREPRARVRWLREQLHVDSLRGRGGLERRLARVRVERREQRRVIELRRRVEQRLQLRRHGD
jgi:hypothetical protein